MGSPPPNPAVSTDAAPLGVTSFCRYSISISPAILSDMDAELAALEARLAKTRALKQGMMQELLTGEGPGWFDVSEGVPAVAEIVRPPVELSSRPSPLLR